MAADDWEDVNDWEDAPTETRMRATKDARMMAAQEDETLPGSTEAPAESRGLLGDVANYASETIADAGRGVVSGATADFDDEAAGALNTLGVDAGDAQAERQRAYEVTGETPGELEAYQGATGAAYDKMRNAMRGEKKAAESRSPTLYAGGQILGAMLMPAGRLAKGASALFNAGRMALSGGALSALAGVGASEREGLKSLKDAAVPGAAGAVLGGAFGGGGTKLAKYYEAMRQRAVAKAAQQMLDKGVAANQSAAGKVGGAISSGIRSEEYLQKVVNDPRISEATRAAAAEKLASAQARQLAEETAKSAVARFDQQLPDILSAKVAKAEAAKLLRPETLQAGADEILARPEMRSRLKSIARDAVLPVAGMVAGGALGDSETFGHHGKAGTGIGGTVGALANFLKPGRRLGNAVASPGFRNDLGRAGAWLAEQAPPLAAATASTVTPTTNALARYFQLLEEKDTP